MQYCTRCLYPENHPLGITFNSFGVCSGCTVHEEKYKINFSEKAKEFERLVSNYRNNHNQYYDCVIHVNGSGDDFYVVDLVKNKFNLNPLLVTYNTQFNTKVGIRNLSRLTTELDCDHIHSTTGPDTIKKITKATLDLIGDMYWHVLAGTFTFPVQVATKFNIPLVIWGVNGWLDQVGQFSHLDRVEMSKKVRKEHGLRMLDAEELLGKSQEINEKDILPFKYPSDEQLERCKVRGIYLNNYFFWNSKKQTEYAIEKFGYETLEQNRTHNNYETIMCHNNAEVHDYIKFLKYGYGKATDHAVRDIRLGRLSREDGIELAEKYDQKKPNNLDIFLDWLNISEEEFYNKIDKFRDAEVWKKSKSGIWEKISSVRNSKSPTSCQLPVIEDNKYIITQLLEDEQKNYILTGRQYIDKNNYKALSE